MVSGKVNFARGDHKRRVAKAADLITKNRYFEENPSLSDDGAALLARPGMRYLTTVGEGPIRGLFSEPGAFGGDMFVASYDKLFRLNTLLQTTTVMTGLFNPSRGFVSMAIVQAIGQTPERLFVADGQSLRYYEGGGVNATGILTASGTISNGDDVQIGDVYYTFTNGSVDSGSPAGTSGAPWLVALGGTAAESLVNLFEAINATGTAGTTYSTALTAHDEVQAVNVTSTTLTVKALFPGAAGNNIATTETGTNLSWGDTTLENGAGNTTAVITTPDDIGIISVITIASFVICIPVQVGEFIGRFYWLEPGEVTLDPLNFATAESYPDAILSAHRFGDNFWLTGEKSTEVWFPTGALDAPFERLQGAALDRGGWEGTVLSIKNTLIAVDENGGVFANRGQGFERISNPGVEEQVRKAIQNQQKFIY